MNRVLKKIALEAGYSTGRYFCPPEFLSLIVTFRCNFRCPGCAIWQKQEFDELSSEQWLGVARNLSAVFGPETFIEINGGEPLIQKDQLIKLIAELKQHFKSVTLNSNGLLIDTDTIKSLVGAGLDNIKISFYSLDKATHNFLRGSDLAYDHAIRALDLLAKSPIRVEVGILITKQNIGQVPELINYLAHYPNVIPIIQPLDERVESAESKNRQGNFLPIDLWPDKNQVNKFFAWIKKDHPKFKNSDDNLKVIEKYYLEPESVLSYRCFAGQRNCVIYPNGDVAMCFKGSIIGNIQRTSIKRILKSSEAVNERKAISRCCKYCRIVGCNFSRGIKEYLSSF